MNRFIICATLFAVIVSCVYGQTQCDALPETIPTPSVSPLNDPFTHVNGKRVTTASDWTCRQNELNQLFQRFELGTKPPRPSNLTASFASNTLTITASNGNASQTITFAPTIQLPTSGEGPFPAIIAVGGSSIPTPAGVAIIEFDNDDIAQQNDQTSRGVGKFFTLYGEDASAGAMMAWAWAISRIIDALEMVPSNANIDLTRLGVTGCSRNGKGALVAGAFDQRIALTIPQESGSGGDACWRISDAIYATGVSTQTAMEIVQENVWFSTNFDPFVNDTDTLPFDHHELAGLVAPRALFTIENTDYEWLGPESSFGCMSATRLIYEALGKEDFFGFSQVGNHTHCDFPSDQQADLSAFIGKFLLGQSTNTSIFRATGFLNYTVEPAQWFPWGAHLPNLH